MIHCDAYSLVLLIGLVDHHQVDPLDFDQKCDGSLPLEDMIPPNPSLRALFESIDRSKARVWGLTNANKPVCGGSTLVMSHAEDRTSMPNASSRY